METTTTPRTKSDALQADGRGTTITRTPTLARKDLATIWPKPPRLEERADEQHPVHGDGEHAPRADRSSDGRIWEWANLDRLAATTTGPARPRADAAAESKAARAARRSPLGVALRWVSQQLRAVADDRSAVDLDLPAVLGATDAELARLNRSLDRESIAELRREAALLTFAGTSLLR